MLVTFFSTLLTSLLLACLFLVWVVGFIGLPLLFWCDDLNHSRMIEDTDCVRRHLRKIAYIEQPEIINWQKDGF